MQTQKPAIRFALAQSTIWLAFVFAGFLWLAETDRASSTALAADGPTAETLIDRGTASDPIQDALVGCGALTFDTDAAGFRTASTGDNRAVSSGPFTAPHLANGHSFQWEATGGNPLGHLRVDNLDGAWQEIWTPGVLDPNFSSLIGQQLQFDYRNDTGYSQYRLYLSVKGQNEAEYYFYFNSQLDTPGSWSRVKVPMLASAFHTGFEASENPGTPADSPAPTNAQFAAVMGNLERIAISVEGVSGLDISRIDNLGQACNYGDAPQSDTAYAITGAQTARQNLNDQLHLGSKINSEPDGQATDYGDAPQEMRSIDAALTNAYPTLLTNNGARHTIVPGISLGAQIDGEADGQPGLQANGDNLTNLHDEDGVALNPTLGIDAEAVVLSGLTNTLVITASANGFLNGWIDYNQNGNWNDAGEQLFNDRTVISGAQTLSFFMPGTAPHGTTYMRFRYSTQQGVAHTVTGAAPDGEVEDYRVEVALPAPASCTTGLINGSFESPTLGSTPPTPFNGGSGYGVYRAADVTGWSFRPTNPAAGANFDQRHAVEIWTNGFQGIPAYQGNQFAEINGFVFGNLYQDVLTVPGSTLAWTVAHRGLRGVDVMEIKIGAPGATIQQQLLSDSNNQWVVYSGSYAVPAGQPITRFEFEAVSSSTGAADSGNLIDAISFSLPCDYGDAPDAYSTTAHTNGASHQIAATLQLGAQIDAEGTGFPSSNADGDNLNNLNDEDSLAALPPLSLGATRYALTGIAVVNRTSQPATLYGWIDANRNSQFDPTEGTSSAVPASTVTQTVDLTWTALTGTVAGQSYVRLRLASQIGLGVTGFGGSGEVEDYPVSILPPGTVVVEKKTLGGEGNFTFSGGLGTFGLTTRSGQASRRFPSVAQGLYAITESVPAGWVLTASACSNGSSPDQVNVVAGSTVTCTFTNTHLSQLTVVQRTVGGNADFVFAGPQTGSFTLTTAAGLAQRSFTALLPGSYAVGRSPSAGWTQTGARCDNGDVPSAITLGPGVDVTCIFTDTRQGSLTVVKETAGDDGSVVFDSSLTPPRFVLTTTQGVARRFFANLLPGTYALTETVPAGWMLRNVACSNGSSPASIAVAPGEDVTCTFRNERLDAIALLNVALGGDATFGYTSTLPANSPFQLTTSASSAYTYFVAVPSGLYAISQTVTPAGWTLVDAACSDGSRPDAIALTPGETLVCTFFNVQQDTIVVEKRTIGGEGSFAFGSPQLGRFALSTYQGIASQSFAGLLPGTYTISESIPAGWTQTAATCSNGDSPDNLTLLPGLHVHCVFTNTRLSSLTVAKQAAGHDETFSFAGSLGTFSLQTTGGYAQRTFANLQAGTYTLSETVPSGWDLSNASCSDGSNPANLDLAPGENVTCTFQNTQRGGLTVVKNTLGADGVFSYTSLALGSFHLSTAGGTAQQHFANLIPATYDLTEVTPSGWRQESAACSDGSSPAAVVVDPGEHVTCTFLNTKLDTIVVVKRSVGGDASFNFTSQLLGNFSLTTVNGEARQSFTNLTPGVYALDEQPLAGWTVESASCSDGSSPASILLAAGETVVCTFTNLKQDTLIVETQALGGDARFEFASPQLGTFSVTTSSGVTRTLFTGLPSAIYSLQESAPAGWDLTSASCDNGDSPDSILLLPGKTVTCTFQNTRRSTLTVLKVVVGEDAHFNFVSSTATSTTFGITTTGGLGSTTLSDLTPGTYDLQELSRPGWGASFALCSNGDAPTQVTLGAGEEVRCAFVNFQRSSLTVVKQTVGGDGLFTFGSLQLGAFSLTTVNGTATQHFPDLPPGGYDLTEKVPPGWDLANASCSDGSDPTSVNLDPGETVVCTFTNVQRSTLVIAQQTQGGDGVFTVTSPQLGAFSLATAGGNAQRTFATIRPGTYSIAKINPLGWSSAGAACSDGSDPANIVLDAGETVTCTFANSKQGRLTVVKQTQGGDGIFPFASQTLGNFVLKTVGGVAQHNFPYLPSGTYALSESPPAGWTLASASCSDGSNPASVSIEPGEQVTCTFVNAKLGTLTVIKQTEGGDATFSWVSQGLGNFDLSTAGGNAQRTFAGLIPGTYDLAETVPAGWQLAGTHCSDGSSPASVSVQAGERVTCTFQNRKLDTIVAIVQTFGGDGSFVFASQTLGSFVLTTTQGTAQRTFTGLTPGTYDLAQTLTSGWTLATPDPVCSNGDPASALRVDPGETVVCLFGNAKMDTLIVEKQSVGGDGAFSFTSPQLGTFVLTTTHGSASQNFDGLSAGTYSVHETVPDGWVLSGASCDNGALPTAIDMTPGLTLRCTLTNTRLSSITLVQQTDGGDGTFAFSGSLGTFNLTTFGGLGQQRFDSLAAGIYTVAAAVPAGWDLTSTGCSDGSSLANIELAPGENVTCTLLVTQRGSLTVVKQTTGGDDLFAFTSQLLGGFVLSTTSGTAQQRFDALPPGLYAVSENVPPGWQQGAVTCSDGSDPTHIAVDPGEAVTCTFHNLKLDTLVILNLTVGGDGTFPFRSQTLGNFTLTTLDGLAAAIFTDLPPGTYDVRARAVADWTQSALTCSNGSNPSSIDLTPGTTVVCTFVSLLQETLVVEKQTVGGDGVFAFTSQTLPSSAFSLTTRSGVTALHFSGLQPGVYGVAEVVSPGWNLTGAVCSDGSTPAHIDLAADETVTCTFTNTQLSRLTVVKHTLDGDGTFTFQGTLGEFSLTTVAGLAQQQFDGLLPGNYSIQENTTAGWSLIDATCNNGSTPGALRLEAGTEVICAFSNSSTPGTLIVRKVTVGGEGVFSYQSAQLGDFTLMTAGGTATQNFSGLPPGQYTITEVAAPGWQESPASCDNGDTPDSVTVQSGQTVTCTFFSQRIPTALPLQEEPILDNALFLPLIGR